MSHTAKSVKRSHSILLYCKALTQLRNLSHKAYMRLIAHRLVKAGTLAQPRNLLLQFAGIDPTGLQGPTNV